MSAVLNEIGRRIGTLFGFDTTSVKDFGVTGDGTDETTKIQNALDSGENIYFPRTATYYAIDGEISPVVDGQVISGSGYYSQIRQLAANANVFTGSGLDNLRFQNLHLYCVGSMSSFYSGGGIYLASCNEAEISGCRTQHHRGAGVLLQDCNDCSVVRNGFYSSTVAANEFHNQTHGDVVVAHASSRNLVAHNICRSGNGYGIYLTTLDSGDNADDNRIIGNLVDGAIGYGIVIYRFFPAADTMFRNVLLGNVVKNITGSQRDSSDSIRYWGAGIYIQGAEYTVIDGGAVYNVCQATESETLAPGAIGVSNCSAVTIDNVDIDTSAWYGVTVRDPNGLGVVGGWATIGSGVKIRGTTKAAAHVVERGNVRCEAVVEESTAQGFLVVNTTPAKEGFDIDMQIADCTLAGVNLDFASDVRIRGRVRGSGTQNVIVANGDDVDIEVVSKDSDDTGIQISSTVTNARVHDSEVTGNLFGMNLAAATRLSNNSVHDNTTNYTGSFALIRTLANSATPSVKYGRHFVTGGTTTITAFSDGEPGQEIIIRSAHTLTIDVTGTTIIGGTNDLSVESGDILHFVTDDGTNWRLVSFMDMSDDYSSGT